MSTYFNSRDRSGFTLVELLVVVAIIALLLAILIPSLSNAREVASRAACLANHRSLTVSSNTYATEYNGLLPWSNYDNGKHNGSDPAGWLYDLRADGNDVNLWNLRDEERADMVDTGSLWEYLNDAEVYRCPYDEGPKHGFNGWNVHPISSYQINGAVSAFGRMRGEYERGERNWPTFKIEQFRGNAILFWEVENDWRRAGVSSNNAIKWWWNDGSNNPNEVITKRHGDGATVSNVDGSAEWITFDEFEEERARLPGRLWCVPDTDTGESRDSDES